MSFYGQYVSRMSQLIVAIVTYIGPDFVRFFSRRVVVDGDQMLTFAICFLRKGFPFNVEC